MGADHLTEDNAIVLDVETTGFSPHADRITEIAILNFRSGEVLMKTYLNPERRIPEDVQKITSITDEMVASAPYFAEIADQLAIIISTASAIIGYNTQFDRGMIAAEFARHAAKTPGFVAPAWPTLVCAKRQWDLREPREERNLTNAYRRFVSPKGFVGAHGALADANATRDVFLGQQFAFMLESVEWAELDPEQKTWYGSSGHFVWKDGVLTCNFGKSKGQSAHVVERGYWQWIWRGDFPEHVKQLADWMIYVGPRYTEDELRLSKLTEFAREKEKLT